MIIVVKPNNITKLNNYIKMGAKAFLFGIKDLSINPTSIVNIKTLTYIKKKLNKDIKLFVSIDKNLFDEELDKVEKVLLELEKLKIDGVFFYDLGLLQIVKENNIKIPLIWNQNYLVTNYETCNYYKEKGVLGAVLSSEITMDDMLLIAKNTKLDLFVNMFGYQTMAVSKRKLITSYYKYLNKFNIIRKHKIFKENKSYEIIENKDGTVFLSNYILNGLPLLNNFKKSNIKYCILDQKNIKNKDFFKIITIYKDCLDNKKSKEYLDKIASEINNTSLGFFNKKTIYKVKNNE